MTTTVRTYKRRGGDSLRVTTDTPIRQKEVNEMNCKHCGQEMSHHYYSYHNRDANQCDIEIVECANCQIEEPAELAALREAGEKMARMLKYVNDMNKQKEIDLDDDWLWAQNSDTGKKILTALAEWEAANK